MAVSLGALALCLAQRATAVEPSKLQTETKYISCQLAEFVAINYDASRGGTDAISYERNLEEHYRRAVSA